MSEATIHHHHLEQIVARLEGRSEPEPRWFYGSCVFWRDGSPCTRDTAEMLVPTHGDGPPAYPVCADHLDEFMVEQLLATPSGGEDGP